MPGDKPPFLPQVKMLHDADRTDEIYARGVEVALAIARRRGRLQALMNALYYGTLLLALGWIFAMVIDREPPVRQVTRESVNPGRQVHAGDRLLIRGVRIRDRSCEITRRWWIVDGASRRLDFEPERFDAYGPIGREEETIGPVIPLDAMPGRGRLLGVVAYDCNPLQRALGWSIIVMLPALDFEILPRAAVAP